MAAAQDQLVFVMASGEGRFVRSVARGRGEEFLRDIFEAGSRWIQVDDGIWILRDHVLYVQLIRSE